MLANSMLPVCSLLTLRLQRGGSSHDVAVGLRDPTIHLENFAILMCVHACLSCPSLLGLAAG